MVSASGGRSYSLSQWWADPTVSASQIGCLGESDFILVCLDLFPLQMENNDDCHLLLKLAGMVSLGLGVITGPKKVYQDLSPWTLGYCSLCRVLTVFSSPSPFSPSLRVIRKQRPPPTQWLSLMPQPSSLHLRMASLQNTRPLIPIPRQSTPARPPSPTTH